MNKSKKMKQLVGGLFVVFCALIVSQIGISSLSIIAEQNKLAHQGMSGIQIGIVAILGIASLAFFYWLGKRLKLLKENPFTVWQKHWKVIVVVAILARVVATVMSILMQRQGIASTDNDQVIRELLQYSNRYLLFFFVSIAAPFMEELVFRGTIIGYWLREYPWIAWLFSSFVFGALHGPDDFLSWVVYVAMGLLFGWVYMRTERIEASMWVHFLNNILGGIAILFGKF